MSLFGNIFRPITSLFGLIEDIPIIGDMVEWIIGPIDSGDSPTYDNPNQVGNTISEDVPIARCYGRCKIGGNKIRFNSKDDADLRVIFAHCGGEVNGITEWKVNDISWNELTGTHTKTEYKGTRTQIPDKRFVSRASAYRGMAYTATTFEKNDSQIGYNPTMSVIMEGLLCPTLSSGSDTYTRNNAVIMYDWYLNVEGYSTDKLDINAFKSLEALCDEIPANGTLPRYRFDYNFDVNNAINDSKKLLWSSFNGRVITSQGKLKPVWDFDQMADGSGGLTAKTVSYAFTEDNIVKGSLVWKEPIKYNIVRIHYLDSTNDNKKTSVEEKDDYDIDQNGELVYEESCFYITDSEIAQRRAKGKLNKFKYTDYEANLNAFSGAGSLELYDLTTITHTLPGWENKKFLVSGKSEDAYGRMSFILSAYYSGIYDDATASDQSNYASILPNPYASPAANTGVSLSLASPGIGFDYDSVEVTFTPPVDPFYSRTEIYVSNDDTTYYLAGISSGENFVIQGMGMFYVPGDTCYIKLRNVNEIGVFSNFSETNSIVITSSICLGSFYAGLYDFWGGNVEIDNADTTIVLGNLDGTTKVALGPSANSITTSGTSKGFIADGDGKVYFGDGSNKYFRFDAENISWKGINTELTPDGVFTALDAHITGELTAGQLHIPDKNTTADSFHVNTNGDAWWGCTETDFNTNYENATSYVLKSGYAKFKDIALEDLITLDHTNSDFFIVNYDNDDIDVEFRFGRTTGGTASFTWNGDIVQCSKPFKPTQLSINNISDTEPAAPFAGQVWIDP